MGVNNLNIDRTMIRPDEAEQLIQLPPRDPPQV